MKTVVIDANVLLSFVTDRNLAQQDKAAALIEAALRMTVRLICPQNVLTEFVYVLDKVYRLSKTTIKPMVADIIAQPGLTVVHDLDYDLLLRWWPDPIADFGDAVVAVVCRIHRPAEAATFDAVFAHQLKRIAIPVFSL